MINSACLLLKAIVICLSLLLTESLLSSQFPIISPYSKSRSKPLYSSASSNDKESSSGGGDDNKLLQELKARQEELQYENFIMEQKWRHADCQSSIQIRLNDFCRRMDVDYPMAAIGSTSGTIYMANLETGEVLAASSNADILQSTTQSIDDCIQLERMRAYLHYGPGRIGTMAVAFSSDLVVASNPMEEMGVQVWRWNDGSSEMLYQGSMTGVQGKLVTCLTINEDYLWVGTACGSVMAFSLLEGTTSETVPLTLQVEPEFQWQFSNSILSLNLSPIMGHGLITTADGCVELISLEEEDGDVLCSLKPPLNGGENAVSALLARVSSTEDSKYAIVCGGGDGTIWTQALQMDSYGEISQDEPVQGPMIKFRPNHGAAVKCLANPIPGLLVSAGLDGSLRVWDLDERESLYQFVGYKIWMGSIWTDGYRLATDGSDNGITVHDFLSEDIDSDL